ncbi:MAG: hypothetical protein CSA72_08375 [Rhodobacterales bacterium]|nr:MAG: hypothetical protein CSA72_08375 [Rhodobacterales bacterium]
MVAAVGVNAPTTISSKNGYVFGWDPASSGNLGFSMGTPVSGSAASAPASNLSYGGGVASLDTIPVGSKLSYGKKMAGGFDLDGFLRTMSMGIGTKTTPVTTTRPAGMSASGMSAQTVTGAKPVGPIPTAHTVRMDGGTSTGLLDGLKAVAAGVLANMGSTGDGDVQPVLVNASAPGSAGGGGGISPMLVIGGALAAGLVYWVAAG